MIESDSRVWKVKKGEAFTAPLDGRFMSDALYMRYCKAVADGIQKAQEAK